MDSWEKLEAKIKDQLQEYGCPDTYLEHETQKWMGMFKDLLQQQKAELIEELENLEWDKEFEGFTHFQNGFDHAIMKAIDKLKNL